MDLTINVEIIAIGNELLLGDVKDTNSNWLCRRITGLGGRVCRTTTIGDDLEVIAAELRAALQRGTALLLSTGGLGPTHDDVTLAGIARALGRGLVPHAEALALIERQYADLVALGFTDESKMTEARRKMAILPQGATPLFNPIGGAPAVLIEEDEATIIALPGVPPEMKSIFEGPMQPILEQLFARRFFLEKTLAADCADESAIAPHLSRVVARHPHVYIKSRAMWLGSRLKVLLTFALSGGSRGEVDVALREAMTDLSQELHQAGISVAPFEKSQ